MTTTPTPRPTIQGITALLKRAGLTSIASKKAYGYGGAYCGFKVLKDYGPRKGVLRVRYQPGAVSGLPPTAEAAPIIERTIAGAGYDVTPSIHGDWLVSQATAK